ncbi:MAG TPA: hypothetical protein VN633_12125 [Bryobacteraceae bacterium]|nr:hypothetical protein [Bryobacteraceae bacterium]
MRPFILTSILLVCCLGASAQRLISLGVTGGVPFTPFFTDQTFTPLVLNPFSAFPYSVHSYSGLNEYLVGPTIEVLLPSNFSVEADALFRPLKLKQQKYVISSPAPLTSTTNYSSWEIPLLLKYRASSGLIRPFFEAGPNFRAVANPIGSLLSKAGVSAGAGINVKIWHVFIAPQVRLTHWGKDRGGAVLNYVASERNQGEFLVGFTF